MFEVLKELIEYTIERKKFVLFPLILIFLFLGGAIVLSEGSAIAPFIYTLF